MRSITLTSLLLLLLCTCGRAQSLDSLKAELRRNNPELRALSLDYKAAMKVGAQQNQLPDLQVGAGLFILPVETRTGPQQFRIGATQLLPWPGKLAAMAATADARAQPLLEKAAIRQLMLIFQLEKAYFSLAGLEAQAGVLRESMGIYGSLNRLALSKVETGKGSSVDVYRVQLQSQQLERELEKLSFLRQQEMVVINELLNRTADMQVTTQETISERVAETLDFAPDLAADHPDLSNHPGLRIYDMQQRANRSVIELTKLEQRPDFGVGLDYIATGRREDMNPLQNGRDVILPRVMASIPLSKGKFSAKRQEEEVRILVLGARQEMTENEFRAEIRRALNAIDNAANELNFLREQSRVIDATITIARSEFANGKRPFDELLRLEEQLIGYQYKAVKAQTIILVQRAVIDRYLINN